MSTLKKYINLNGEFYDSQSPVLSHLNRGFLYGDALFETMHANGTQIQFFEDHIKRLTEGMKKLKMILPESFITQSIEKQIVKLLRKNRHLKGARIRLTVFRDEGGKYTPQTNEVSYLIDSEKLPTDQYELNKKGLQVDLFSELKKPLNYLSNLKTTNDLIYVLAGNFKKEHNLDECILINQKNEVCEAISSNLFLVKEDVIKTPPLNSGCLNGIMRKKIIEYAEISGMKISKDYPVAPQELLECDEIFLTNAIKGIQWVSGFRQKRFFKTTAQKLMQKLNEMTALE
jgi:branched-chain amino acid aminotransferase